MADSTKLLLFGGAAAAVWYFYFRTPSPAPGVIASPAAPGAPTAPGVPAVVTPTPPPASSPNTLAAIQARTVAAANAPAAGLGVDAWGWYLNNELAPLGKSAPDPMSIFGAGFDRSQLVPAADYWSKMGPALQSQLGLSGYRGLGLYGWVQ